MNGRDATVRRHELGNRVREIRERAGFRRKELSEHLGWDQSLLARREVGERPWTEFDLLRLLAFCRATDAEIDELLRMNRAVDERYWLSDNLRTLIKYETTAGLMRSYEPMVVPGLLQTEDYARALFYEAGLVPAEQIEERVRARMDRQVLLNRKLPPQTEFFIHENALRAPVGPPRVRHEQMLKLLFAESDPACSIRVIPANLRGTAGLGGPFVLMRFTDHTPVAYAPTRAGGLFVEDKRSIERYMQLLWRLAELALDRRQSREYVARLASEFERMREGPL